MPAAPIEEAAKKPDAAAEKPPLPRNEPPSDPRQTPKPAETSKPGNKRYLYIGSAAAALVLLALGLGVHNRAKSKPPAPPAAPIAKVRVTLRSTPAGAEISLKRDAMPRLLKAVNFNSPQANIAPRLDLADYQPAVANFAITADQSAPPEINLILSPPPPLVAISTDLADGVVLLDQAKIAQIQGADIEIPKLPAGPHTIFVQNGAFRSSFTVDVADGVMPKLNGPIKTQGLHGFVLTHAGSDAKLYASDAGAKATLDGKDAGIIDAKGLDLRDVPAGSHELLIDAPAAHARIAFTAGPAPSIQASITSDQSLSVLNIVTHEDGVQVFLNNDPFRGLTKNGGVRLYLPAKKYSVRVHKDGFAAPPEQVVDLRKGQESQIEFHFASPKATLAIHRGLPGAEILVDGKHVGLVRSDGEFSAAYIDPGKHSIQIRHDRYKTIQSDQLFANGKAIELDGTMQGLFGTLKIEVSPVLTDLHLRIRRQGEPQDRDIKETTLSLPEGTYIVLASAPKYQDAAVTVRITPDGTSVASLSLRALDLPVAKVTPPPKPALASFLLNDWLKSGWTRDGTSITHQGGGFPVGADYTWPRLRAVFGSLDSRKTHRVGHIFSRPEELLPVPG